MASNRAEYRIIFTVKKQIVIDGTHPTRDAQPAVKVIKRRLRAAIVLIAARLKFNREQRLLEILQCNGHGVHQKHLVKVSLAYENGIDICRTDHAF